MSASDLELAKMIRGFRVTDLQALLSYAGRNKGGKKYELQTRALDLIKLHLDPIDLKVREIHHNRYSQSRGHTEAQDVYPLAPINDPMGTNYGSRSGHQGRMGSSGMSGYIPNLGKHLMGPPPHLNTIPQYPVNPDVRLKELPFYDVLSELLRPTSLVTLPSERFQERDFIFYLTPQQVQDLQNSPDVQVQMRICLLDTSSEQDDEIPSSICLKINNKVYNLPNLIPTNRPGAEPKRPKRPIDITDFTKKTSTEGNEVFVSWATSASKPYVMAIYLVRKLTSSTLIKRLKGNGVRNPDHTTAMIKEKLLQDRDSEIATMSLKGSLTCPLGKIRMKLPCRALTCSHLQCFDATLYLQMNEKKPKWICPVCDKPAYFKSLAIDGLFLDITTKAPLECTEVQFHEDGSWTPVMPVKKQPEVSDAFESIPKEIIPKVETSKPKRPVEVISLDSDSDTEDSWPILPPKKMYKPGSSVSPVLIGSPDENRNSENAANTFNPFAPCTSKTEPTIPKIITGIPERSSLPPLPETLDIDPDVDCLLGTLNVPRSSSYEDVTPASSPKDFCAPTANAYAESVEILGGSSQNSNRNYSNFDLYSLISSQNQEESYNNYPQVLEDEGSPDVINID